MLKKHLFISLILLFLTGNSFSQKDYINGYVILNNSDTLYGKIKDRKTGSFGKLYTKIKFKPQQGRIKKYSPNDLTGYKTGESCFVSMWFHESNQFLNPEAQSRPHLGEKRFLKLVISGYLSFYHLEYINEDGNLDYTAYFKRQNESLMVFARYGLFGLNKKQLVAYFKDCPELQQKISSKEFTTPYEVIVFYNDWYSKQ